jgi:glycosyltransferase involved in cell wall biosynthesis
MSKPAFSIVIEWDNARYAALARTRQMLRTLASQIAAQTRPEHRAEVFLIYDRHSIDGAMVSAVVKEDFTPDPALVDTHILPTDGLHYYEQKNFGARMSSGEVVILLDCDIIPEPGWLAAMLAPFDRPEVNVVAGDTYLQYTGLYSKAFALFWYFTLRDGKDELVTTTFFHANNVAFRADVFAAYPFPRLEAYRIQCTMLCERLQANGIPIYLQKAARASHPPPLGAYFFTRALNNGRDEILEAFLIERRNSLPPRMIYWNYAMGLIHAYRKFVRGYKAVQLGRVSAVAAYGVAVTYFTLKACGAAFTYYYPRLAQRLFPA